MTTASTVPAAELLTDLPAEQYFAMADQAISHSELEVFRESPELYHGRFIEKIWPQAQTEAMRFGSIFHAMLLEDKHPTLIPREVLASNGARLGNKWKEWAAERTGECVVTDDEAAILYAMLASVKADEMANQLVFGGPGLEEVSLRFTWRVAETADGVVDVDCRCRLDRLVGYREQPAAIVDIKTVDDADPRTFSQKAHNFGYARQADFYTKAVEVLTGQVVPFVFVAVQKTPPYTCQCMSLKPDFLTLGRTTNRLYLQRFAEAKASNNWQPRGHNQIVEIDAPAYAYSESSWTL